MSYACRARAETPRGAIALGTTPLHGCWQALQSFPAAATQLCTHDPLLATPALLLCAPILLVCITPLSPLTTVAVLALFACFLAITVPSHDTPRRLEPVLAVSEHGTLDAPRLDEHLRSPAFLAALLVLWRCLYFTIPPDCRKEAGCGTGRGICAAPRPRLVLDASPAAPPTG